MNRLSLRNNWLKFKTAGKLPTTLEDFVVMYPNLIQENRRMSICNRLDLQTLGSRPVMMPKKLPDHWFASPIGCMLLTSFGFSLIKLGYIL